MAASGPVCLWQRQTLPEMLQLCLQLLPLHRQLLSLGHQLLSTGVTEQEDMKQLALCWILCRQHFQTCFPDTVFSLWF